MATPETLLSSVITQEVRRSGERRRSSVERFRSIVNTVEVFVDFTATYIGVYLAYYLYLMFNVGKHVHYSSVEIAVVASVVSLMVLLLLSQGGAYGGGGSLLQIRETERSIRVPTQVLLLLLPLAMLSGRAISRGALLFGFLVLPLVLSLAKHLFYSLVRALHAKGIGSEKVLIYGGGYTGRRVLSALLHSPKLGLNPVAVVDDDPQLVGTDLYELGYSRTRSVPVIEGPVGSDLLQAWGCNRLVIAIPGLQPVKFQRASEAALAASIPVAFVPRPELYEDAWTESLDVDGFLLTSLREPSTLWHYAALKRAIDLLFVCILLVLLAPLMIAVAVLVKLDSPGPIFFVQERVGRNGVLFKMFKFRSMRTDAPKYCASPSESQDPRITKVGRFLRKTSIDELPQLFNVLLGNMSLVGPRPEMPFIVEQYDLLQRQRLQVVPGITGLWQLSADRAFHIHENIQYDLYYLRHRSFFLDLAILIHTVFFAMRGV